MELTPEQSEIVDMMVGFVVEMGKAIDGMTKAIHESKVPAPELPRLINELAKRILARDDCPEMFRMPLPLLEEWIHLEVHLSDQKDEEIKKLQ